MQHQSNTAPDIARFRREKSADQIQAEIDLMRLAYRERLDEDAKPRTAPLLIALPYLASLLVMILGMVWLLF